MKILATAALVAAFACLACALGGMYIATAAFGALAFVYARLAHLSAAGSATTALRIAGVEALVNGNVERVVALTDAFAPLAARDANVASMRAQLRAFVAIAKGDPRAAVTVLDEVMASDSGRALALQRAHYLPIRALAHALAGNDDAALADVDASLSASPVAANIARATLAKAIVISRRGEPDRLREIAAQLPTMLWAYLRHERTLARAIVRASRPTSTSAYRGNAAPNAPWFAANVPALGAVAPPTIERRERQVTFVTPRIQRPWAAYIAYTATAAGVVAALVAKVRGIPEPDELLAVVVSAVAVIVAVVQLALIAKAVLDQRRGAAGLARVQLLGIEDNRAAVWNELELLVRKVDQPEVRLQRAVWLGADGKLRAALDEVALGLAAISPRARGLHPQYAELVGERAVLFATLGHAREANAALDELERGFDGHPLLDVVRHQVALFSNVQAKRWSDAFESARLGAGLTLPVRDELLTESLVAIADGDAHAAALLTTEIEARSEIAHWFDVVAPGVLERLRSVGRT